MENKFDKDLKQRLGEASLPEAGLHLDKDKLWAKIEKKKPGKRIAFMPWISHAAAVAAGLAAGIFLFVHRDPPGPEQQIVVQQKRIPAAQPVTDTVYVAKAGREPAHQQPPALQKKPIVPVTVIALPVPQPVSPTPDINIHENEARPVLVMNKPVPAKVLHLSDMDNENAIPGNGRQKKPSFFAGFPDRNATEISTETFTMLIGEKLNLTKN